MVYDRIIIVGKAGAGKTTLSGQLAQKLSLPAIELDAINWQPDWVSLRRPEMRLRVDQALPPSSRWVADGNYTRSVCDIVWNRADTLIWLDYPLHLALWRVLKRTIMRIFTRRELWNGNRESLWHHLTTTPNENLFVWTVKMHWNQRKNYPLLFEMPEYSHLNILRFRTPKETEIWLNGLPSRKNI
jgi:GTPase SAR1 family protein